MLVFNLFVVTLECGVNLQGLGLSFLELMVKFGTRLTNNVVF